VTERQATEQEWTPAFPSQRPPFPKNHELSLRHGAWSARLVEPRAVEIAEELLADDGVAYLRQPRWAAAVAAWARCEARCQLVAEYLVSLVGEGQLGDLEDPKVAAAYRLLDRFEASATQQRGRLGLDPLSASKIGRDTAASSLDVAKIMSELHHMQQAKNEEDDEG
jgi:hypothetical protein